MLYKLKGNETPEEIDRMLMDIYYDYYDFGIVSIIEKHKENYDSKN